MNHLFPFFLKPDPPPQGTLGKLAALVCFLFGALPLQADLLGNLQSFPDRIAVGDPRVAAADGEEGPKGIASADFNGDQKPDLAVSNLDGTLTVLIGLGEGRFAPPQHIHTGVKELRSVVAADLNGDGMFDLATASFEDGKLLLFFNRGGGKFTGSIQLPGWVGVRTMAAGDFDGDGITDLAAAGPGLGVRHFRGTGGGAFEIMGDLKRLSPIYQNLTRTRPVYALRTLRSRDGRRDDLLVTHFESPSLWLLSTKPVDRSSEPLADLANLPEWGTNPSPVLITEVQVQNANTLYDADGTAQPWVELLNKSALPVNLAGWTLSLTGKSGTQGWTFPSVTLPSGRFLVVFLSGKNRLSGPELHTSLVLKENTDLVTLRQPGGSNANGIELPGHVLTGVSRGLAPDSNEVKWFDLPSPGAANNAGESKLEDISQETVATLMITPREPAPRQQVTIKVTLPEKPTGSSNVRNVWFSATPGLEEVHHLLHRISPGVFGGTLPAGAFAGNTPHRVLVRMWDGLNDRNDYTVQIHPGLDEPEAAVAVRPRPGCLLPVASTPSPKVKAFEAGPIFTRASQPGVPAQPGVPVDLVYVDEKNGVLKVHRATPSGTRRFEPMASTILQITDPLREPTASTVLQITGSLRDIKLADTNGDGWLDVTVVKRDFNLVHTFRNESGKLIFGGEIPTGTSPRELVMADFTGDGKADAAVINRVSADISILAASAGTESGLVSLDQVYAVDGDVGALLVKDLDGDGRDDVLQLHRASGEISVRYSGPGGRLEPPQFYLLGAHGACAATLADVNNDRKPDLITANLGVANTGSISVLLGRTGRGFQTARVFGASDKLFAISVADFDNDGNPDIAAGLWDCRISFFRGAGDGSFASHALPVPFVNESRVMVTRDFDQDGDIDIAGAGYDGDMVTLENRAAFGTGGWFRRYYPPPQRNVEYGADRIGPSYVNGDQDADLIIGTLRGIILYRAGPGMAFTLVPPAQTSGINLAVSDVFTADIDSDGILDMVTACRDAACVNVLSQTTGGLFKLRLQVNVPSARYIATGDLDGDGKPDLVGTGNALWTVLSNRPPQPEKPESSVTNRPRSTEVVINEVLGRNTGVALPVQNGGKSDFIELFNGTGKSTTLNGWTVQLESNQEGKPVNQSWPLPPTTLETDGRLVIVCAENPAPLHTGFTLPAEGGTITLRKGDGSVADRVDYPYAQENVSWSRYQDGHPSFHANQIPSPGLSNIDNGNAPPTVTLTPPSPEALKADQPLKFTARGRDDLGIVSMSLYWNRLDAPLAEPQRLVLYDDGLHGDRGPVDGYFAGTMPPLPAGAEVQFYLQATDLSGGLIQLPKNAMLSAPGDPPVAWSFAIASPPTLEISEVCTNNEAIQRDELGGYPDYVKVRHTGAPGSPPIDMSPIILAKSLLSEAARVYSFPLGFQLSPGGEVTVFADEQLGQGPFHAPFSFDAGGDVISLLAVRPSGGRLWIHSVTVPEITVPDSRLLRLPGTSLHAVVEANSDLSNWSGISYDANGTALATLHFLSATGTSYRVEGDAAGAPVAWSLLQTIPGNDQVMTFTRPLTQMASLRVVPNTVPSIRVDAAMGGLFYEATAGITGTAGIYGEAKGVTSLTLYYGRTQGGTSPASWSHSVGGVRPAFNSTVPFAWFLRDLTPDTTYYFTLKADLPNGGVIWYSGTASSFRTLNPGTSAPVSLTLAQLNPTHAAVRIDLTPLAPPNSNVEILVGPVDAFSNSPAWQRRFPATRTTPGGTEWKANIPDLARDTTYHVRARVTSSTGQVISAQRITFRTPDAKANLFLNLRVSEIMYHPRGPKDPTEFEAGYGERDFEFIELHNPSDESMDLSGIWFTGVDFDFPLSGGPLLPPGGYAVIAANPLAFASRYGAQIPLAGWTLHPFRNSRLSNGGERLALQAADGTLLFAMEYDDRGLSDGDGASLEYRLPADPLRPEDAKLDYAPGLMGGTPGGSSPPAMSYHAWKLLHFSAAQANDPAFSGMNADPDRDGLTNFSEYAHGTLPLQRETEEVFGFSINLPARRAGTFEDLFTFKANLAAKEAVFLLESSDDCANWQQENVFNYGDHLLRHLNYLVTPPDFKQIKVTVSGNTPLSRPRHKFWRVKVSNR